MTDDLSAPAVQALLREVLEHVQRARLIQGDQPASLGVRSGVCGVEALCEIDAAIDLLRKAGAGKPETEKT